MKLVNREVHDFLKNHKVDYLFHANTVATSISYLEIGGLLSRQSVENRKLYQTSQNSDFQDKRFNVYNDIFFDTIDLHKYFSRNNYYGPVCFVFSTDILLSSNFDIWITKQNPINWKSSMKDTDKYISDLDELESTWNDNRQKKMLTIKNISDPISFQDLQSIIIDNPQIIKDRINYFEEALNGIEKAGNSFQNKISERSCSNCYCHLNYSKMDSNRLNKLFLPKK